MKQNVRNREKATTLLVSGVSGCSADSFMLRDGVCDDSTNTAQCLYDGGDCCLENKAIHLCRDCVCRLATNDQELIEKSDGFKVMAFENHLQFDDVVASIEKTVANVETSDICSVICLDQDILEAVNAWHYDGMSQNCRCGWIDYGDNDRFGLVGTQFASSNIGTFQSFAFVLADKLTPTGTETFQNAFYNVIDTKPYVYVLLECMMLNTRLVSIYSFENKAFTNTRTAALCRQSCEEHIENCQYFSWLSEMDLDGKAI